MYVRWYIHTYIYRNSCKSKEMRMVTQWIDESNTVNVIVLLNNCTLLLFT